eukprot:GHVH01006746.1.p1 GENE.GHVH01006746.1~~GHVH01006746.1.p1  ORF type:complete len:106 (+),score=21.86 GHVH01006746.1:527-844(+)
MNASVELYSVGGWTSIEKYLDLLEEYTVPTVWGVYSLLPRTTIDMKAQVCYVLSDSPDDVDEDKCANVVGYYPTADADIYVIDKVILDEDYFEPVFKEIDEDEDE